MQDQAKAERNNTSLLLVILFTIACILAWWGYCWYEQVPIGNANRIQHLRVIFDNIAGLNNNANVYLDGVKIGQVHKSQWMSSDHVLVLLNIDRDKATITKDAKFAILSNGLVGAKYIDVSMPDYNSAPYNHTAIADENFIFRGEPTVRPELALAKLTNVITEFDSDQFGSRLRSDRRTIMHAVRKITVVADKLIPVEERALPMEREIIALSSNLRVSIKRFDRFLANPKISQDLKDIMRSAKETTAHIQEAVHDLDCTLQDKQIRQDIILALANLNDATGNIEQSTQLMNNVASDPQIRSDLKQMLCDARYSIERIEKITERPTLESDIHSTLGSTREAIDRLNLVAQQINQILDKRHPLIHLLIGRPGHVKNTIIPSN